VYALNGTVYDSVFVTQLMQEAAAEIRLEYPFFSLRMIYATSRTGSEPRVFDQLTEALSLRERWPGFVLGFDLVGNEYTGHSLLYYLDDFLAFQNVSDASAVGLPYYFHAGESMYAENTNLYDAVLLHTRRIGHGFALSKFEPVLSRIIRERQICLEVCPISNQVLKLVEDLRNHPAVNFLHLGRLAWVGTSQVESGGESQLAEEEAS
jgi:adenosine deaminase-related growth factor